MSDSTPPVARNLKSVAALVAALTALVTACTSLVKATDKSVEQVSYETLSKKIVELQESNVAMTKLIHEYDERTREPVVPPPALSSSSEPAMAFGVDAGSPLPPHLPTPFASAKPPRLPRPPLPPRPPAPPSWKEVKEHASKL